MVLAYDHDNHLTEVHGAIDKLATYEYDALARRIVMVDWSNSPNLPLYTIRQYIYSGQNVVEEYDGDQDRACYYVHGPSYIDERVLMYDEASEADYVYLLKDLYTVAGLADAWGWLVEAYDYDAYGKVTMRRCAVLPDAADYDADGDVDDDDLAVFAAHENGPGNDPCDVTDPSVIPGWRSDFDGDGDVDGSDYIVFAHAYGGAGVSPRGVLMLLSGPMPASRVANPYFFTGRRLDLLDIDDANTPNHFTDDTPRLPLYHYRARAMDPVVGRFLQRDPLGVPEGSFHAYYDGENGQRLRGVSKVIMNRMYSDGMSLYEYVRSLPQADVDPLGLKGWCRPYGKIIRINYLRMCQYCGMKLCRLCLKCDWGSLKPTGVITRWRTVSDKCGSCFGGLLTTVPRPSNVPPPCPESKPATGCDDFIVRPNWSNCQACCESMFGHAAQNPGNYVSVAECMLSVCHHFLNSR